jgi:hypothetical protein
VINALKDGLSPPIALSERTVSVHVSRQLLEGVDLRIWDFAGECGAGALALCCLVTRLLQGRRCTTCRTPCILRSAASTC